MTADNSLLVNYQMLKLKRDDYPHWRGQSWADPSVDHALALLRPVLADPTRGRAIAERGQAEVLRSHGNRAVGLRILARLQRIVAESEKVTAAPALPAGRKPTGRKRAKATA